MKTSEVLRRACEEVIAVLDSLHYPGSPMHAPCAKGRRDAKRILRTALEEDGDE